MSIEYIVLILTHGRPDRVHTLKTLRTHGYTGPIALVVDDMDDTKDEYVRIHGERNTVHIFNKKESAKLFDVGDNFDGYRGVVYARNVAFEVAKQLGHKYFIVLDDDYRSFRYRFDHKLDYCDTNSKRISNLDTVFQALLRYFVDANFDSLAMAQGGDFIGGKGNPYALAVKGKRKLMNLFVCSTDKPFEFMGRLNEDVNCYTYLGARGKLFLTLYQCTLEQTQTQANAGGLTELYLDAGTYVKSFYSVLFQPSSVSVAVLKDRDHDRLHHKISWKHTVPKILPERYKKTESIPEQ